MSRKIKDNGGGKNDVIVKVEGLSHRYTKDWAIEDLNFEITRDGILGLLGSNGAGKSTFMNILCGVLHQTRGEVFIKGINIREYPLEVRKLIGFLPQQAPLYFDLTVNEYLTYCAHLRKVEPKDIKRAVEAAMSKCGVAHFSNRLINNLSGGYRQRVGIAQAIVHKPTLLVLDEPTTGLDPNQIIEVRKLIKEISEEQSIILSTHVLSEVHAICDKVKMIELGHIVFDGAIGEFADYIEPHKLRVVFASPPPRTHLLKIKGVDDVEVINKTTLRLSFDGDRAVSERIIRAAARNGWSLRELSFERSSLDEVFAHLSAVRKQDKTRSPNTNKAQ